jgi:hypothetical protein
VGIPVHPIGYGELHGQAIEGESVSADGGGFRAKGEGAIGDLAQAVLENPLFSQALGKALGAGERAAQAQRAALGAVDISTASDTERLSRRVRALSDRVEVLEDSLDEMRRELAKARKGATSTSS